MPEIIIDSRYVALKLIRLLYDKGQINRETYECVMQKYGAAESGKQS